MEKTFLQSTSRSLYERFYGTESMIDKNVNKKSIKIPVFPSKQEHACGKIQALL